MGRRVNTYDYLPKSIKNRDNYGEMATLMKAIDTALDDVADSTLLTNWDIEKASRDELNLMATSIGLFPQNYMTDELVRKYIRASGRIRELKGTDTLIEYLVDTMTRFKVYEIVVDDANQRQVNVKLYYGTHRDYEYQQKVLDFLINSYKRLMYDYGIVMVSLSQVTWANSIINQPHTTKMFAMKVTPLEDIMRSVNTTVKGTMKSNTFVDGAVDKNTTLKLSASKTTDLARQLSISRTVKMTQQRIVDPVPEWIIDSKTKLSHFSPNTSMTTEMINGGFKIPFELVTMQ